MKQLNYFRKEVLVFSFSIFLFFFSFNIIAQCPMTGEAGLHYVQSNENLFRIAIKYNISIEDICTWNSIEKNDPLYKCQELVISSALLTPLPPHDPSIKAGRLLPKKQSGKWHTVRTKETIASLAKLYGYTEERFREFNKLSTHKVIKPGAIIRSSDCACDKIPDILTPKGRPAEYLSSPESDSQNLLTKKETEMIDEINLMRSNPKAYIKHVKKYASSHKETWGTAVDQRSLKSLILDLEQSPKLSTLSFHPCIYEAAKTHGKYLKSIKQSKHSNANGDFPFRRITNACPKVKMGKSKSKNGLNISNENLAAGKPDARKTVISLLLDEGESPALSREILLAPEWKFVACYNYGTINGIGNHWVQKLWKIIP